MTNYKLSTYTELVNERHRLKNLISLASMLSNDDPQKEQYLRLYHPQLQYVEKEIKARKDAADLLNAAQYSWRYKALLWFKNAIKFIKNLKPAL